MKPYSGRDLIEPKRIFNYRLSRARRTIENAFGIMSARFRVLREAINQDAAKTRQIVKATCALHNFLLARGGKTYSPKGFADEADQPSGLIVNGSWRNDPMTSNFLDLPPASGRDRTPIANRIRDEFQNYFSSTGSVPWQYKNI